MKDHKVLIGNDVHVLNVFLKFCSLYTTYEDFKDLYDGHVDLTFPFNLKIINELSETPKEEIFINFMESFQFHIEQLEDFLEENELNYFPKYLKNEKFLPNKSEEKEFKEKFYKKFYNEQVDFDEKHENYLKKDEKAKEILKIMNNIQIDFGPVSETRKLFLNEMKNLFKKIE